jgi:ABC-type anion transport system duplicated permease subunit
MRNFLETKGYVVIIAILVLLTMYSLLTSLDKKQVKSPINKELIDVETKRIADQKKAIELSLDEQEKQVKILLKKLDSLQNSKTKIQIKYVTKYREIDSASSFVLAKEFDSIFSSHNLK